MFPHMVVHHYQTHHMYRLLYLLSLTVPLIECLLASRSPATVAWLIVPIDIGEAIEGLAFRP
jgi:hypothetical protein